MKKATVVFIQVPVSLLGDVARALEWASDDMHRASSYEYSAGDTLRGDNLIARSNKLAKIAEVVKAKKARLARGNNGNA